MTETNRKETCLKCYHFPVCYVSQRKAMEQEAWNRDITRVYKAIAHGCDFYELRATGGRK